MAITVNGYIANTKDDTDWVKDLDALYKTIAAFGVIVMGKRTYLESEKYSAFPYKNALNIVMTHDKTLLNKTIKNVLFTDKSPTKVIDEVKNKGYKKLLIIGGGHINGSFLKENLIDEIILDIHPMIMAKGINVFESDFPYKNLELSSFEQINDKILQVRYTVNK